MWEEVPRAFCCANFDICSLRYLKVSGSAGCVVYVFEKRAAVCVTNGGSVVVILFIITSVRRMVSGIRIIFGVCFAVFMWGSLGNFFRRSACFGCVIRQGRRRSSEKMLVNVVMNIIIRP